MDFVQFIQGMDWNEALNNLLNAVVVVLGGLIARYVVPLLKQSVRDSWIEKAVQAAEQIYQEPGSGTRKKEYVTSALVDLGVIRSLRSGTISDSDDLRIEAAVRRVSQSGRAGPVEQEYVL